MGWFGRARYISPIASLSTDLLEQGCSRFTIHGRWAWERHEELLSIDILIALQSADQVPSEFESPKPVALA